MNEMTQNDNELRENDAKQNFSHLYDRLKDEYEHVSDPDGKWPTWSKEEVIAHVERGGWQLAEGKGGGVTVFQSNGRILYGSPPPMPVVGATDPYNDELIRVRESLFNLNRDMDHDVLWLGALMTKVQAGDMAAVRLYSEIFVVPKPIKNPSLSAKTVNVSYNSKPEEPPVRDV